LSLLPVLTLRDSAAKEEQKWKNCFTSRSADVTRTNEAIVQARLLLHGIAVNEDNTARRCQASLEETTSVHHIASHSFYPLDSHGRVQRKENGSEEARESRQVMTSPIQSVPIDTNGR
uniref:Uncharacterized protein n=1 Tax=Cyclopterus lumpus TaxID=8103 RepID=A0A8C2ZDG1_CYCLU